MILMVQLFYILTQNKNERALIFFIIIYKHQQFSFFLIKLNVLWEMFLLFHFEIEKLFFEFFAFLKQLHKMNLFLNNNQSSKNVNELLLFVQELKVFFYCIWILNVFILGFLTFLVKGLKFYLFFSYFFMLIILNFHNFSKILQYKIYSILLWLFY